MDEKTREWIYSDVRFDVRPIIELALMTNDEEWFHNLIERYGVK